MDNETKDYIDSKFEELNKNLLQCSKLISISISAAVIAMAFKVDSGRARDEAKYIVKDVMGYNLN